MSATRSATMLRPIFGKMKAELSSDAESHKRQRAKPRPMGSR
jgi:hypothetical protein